ncbi:MAG: hypothetical protein R3A48_12825 [Polyangiales bacterium]
MSALHTEPPANDTGSVSDRIVDLVARLELQQREAWALELGIDPATADLLALPPVPPSCPDDVYALVARLSA